MPENIVNLKKGGDNIKNGYMKAALSVAVTASVAGIVSLCAEMAAYAIGAGDGNTLYAFICLVFAVVSLLVVTPLVYGMKRQMFFSLQGIDTEIFEMFYLFGTRRYFKYILIKTIVYMRAVLSGALFYLGAESCFVIIKADYFETDTQTEALLKIVGIVCVLVGASLSVYSIVKAFMCDYIFTYDCDCGIFKTLAVSSKLMKGKKMSLITLVLKLSPLYTACLTLVAIPFVVPLVQRKTAEFAMKVKGDLV